MRLPVPTLACAGVVMLLTSMRHTGFMLFFVAIPLVPWLLYALVTAAVRPARRSELGMKAFIWLASVAIVVGLQLHRHATTRDKADLIVRAVERHVQAHGTCPKTLDEVGVSREALRGALGLAAYICEGGRPSFFYGSTYVPFETEQYDFQARAWHHVYD